MKELATCPQRTQRPRPRWLAAVAVLVLQFPVAPAVAQQADPPVAQAFEFPDMPLPSPVEQPPTDQRKSGLDPAGRVVMSLAVVLGAFFLFAWFTRRRGGRSSEELPPDAVELLGELPLGGRETAKLIRVGSKLVLAASNGQSLTPLTEITDPVEVEQLSALCGYVPTRRMTRRGVA
ncbi:MAG: flagellar biosynthetic protein FliO [Planctomycetales bacterium]|nr:flagellar biosynthetic protein FliO [Planctomycetales bacterium]